MPIRQVWSARSLGGHYGVRAAVFAFSFFLLSLIPVDFGTGSAALQAHHFPNTCGGEGQRPCKIWEHSTSCKPGLVEVLLTRCKADKGNIVDNVKEDAKQFVNPNSDPSCGGLGQQACLTSCDSGLMLEISSGSCIQNKATLIRMAKSLGGELEPILEAMGRTIIDCGGETIVKGLKARNKAQAQSAAQRLIDRNCVTVLLEEAQRAGYNTVTVGYGGAVAFIVGGEAEAGIAYDVGFDYFPSAYGVLGVDVGTQVEVSPASVVISVYKGNNQPGANGFGGDAHGVSWGGKFAVGGGMALWWNYDGSFSGASVAIGSGIEAEFAYVRNTTSVYNPLEVIWDNAQPEQVTTRPVITPTPRPITRPTSPGVSPSPRQATTTELALSATQNIAAAIADAQRIEQERRQRETWFQVCNKAKVDGKKVKKMGFVFAYWAEGSRGGAEGWLSEGWWTLKKGKCQIHNLPNGPDGYGMNYTVMLFANIGGDVLEDGPRHYKGDGLMFCVRGGSQIRAADQAACTGENERLVQGIPFEVGPGGSRFEFQSAGIEGLGYLDPAKFVPN